MKPSNSFTNLLVLFIFLLAACNDGRPKGVLSKEKMQAVLWDVAMAGEFANGYIYYSRPVENRVAVNNKLLDEIYRIHGIKKKDFEKSLEYYKQRPKQFMAILDSITAKQTGARPGEAADPATANPGITSPPPFGGPPGPALNDAPVATPIPH